ncbi:hypothetical protein C0992_003452 [Termitomyces sp. T32_za158]|nr:hypothetical protein C0992_003452 [Termitomyces sp. T32_za158]
MEKVRLGSEHLDFHALLSALTQILEGLILNAWHCKRGHQTLGDFTTSNPTDEKILEIAQLIIEKYATPMESFEPCEKKKVNRDTTAQDNGPNISEDEYNVANTETTVKSTDAVHENVVRLT